MATAFFILMFGLNRLAPNIYPEWFLNLSRILGALCVVWLLLWALLGIFVFTAFEIMLGLTIAPWVGLFEHQTRAYIEGRKIKDAKLKPTPATGS
jgi:hypothetical protein